MMFDAMLVDLHYPSISVLRQERQERVMDDHQLKSLDMFTWNPTCHSYYCWGSSDHMLEYPMRLKLNIEFFMWNVSHIVFRICILSVVAFVCQYKHVYGRFCRNFSVKYCCSDLECVVAFQLVHSRGIIALPSIFTRVDVLGCDIWIPTPVFMSSPFVYFLLHPVSQHLLTVTKIRCGAKVLDVIPFM